MVEPLPKPFRPAVIILACSRALAAEGIRQLDGLRLVRMPCSSKIETAVVLKAFEAGAAGVAVVPCQRGSCQYVEGNLRAEALAGGVREILDELGIPSGRFAVYPLDQENRTGLAAFLTDFKDRVESQDENVPPPPE